MYVDHSHKHETAIQDVIHTVEEELRLTEIANRIVGNRAKVQHAKQEMEMAVQEVESAGRKIANVYKW